MKTLKVSPSRDDIFDHVKSKYDIEPDYPWIRDESAAVLRHLDSKKWFALIMNIPKRYLGLPNKHLGLPQRPLGLKDDARIDAVNVKLDSMMILSLLDEVSFFPAYHMSKRNWMTIVLNEKLSQAKLYELIDISYRLTKKKSSGDR